MSNKHLLQKKLILTTLCALSLNSAHAFDYTWSAGAGTHSWQDTDSWTPSGSPAGFPASPSDTATFPNLRGITVTSNADVNIGKLTLLGAVTFNTPSTNTTTSGYTFAGIDVSEIVGQQSPNLISISDGNLTFLQSSGINEGINLNGSASGIVLSNEVGSAQIATSTGSRLNLGTYHRSIQMPQNSTLKVGDVKTGGMTGHSLELSGGTLELAGENTLSGPLTIKSSSKLRLDSNYEENKYRFNSLSLEESSSVTQVAPNLLEITGSADTVLTLANSAKIADGVKLTGTAGNITVNVTDPSESNVNAPNPSIATTEGSYLDLGTPVRTITIPAAESLNIGSAADGGIKGSGFNLASGTINLAGTSNLSGLSTISSGSTLNLASATAGTEYKFNRLNFTGGSFSQVDGSTLEVTGGVAAGSQPQIPALSIKPIEPAFYMKKVALTGSSPGSGALEFLANTSTSPNTAHSSIDNLDFGPSNRNLTVARGQNTVDLIIGKGTGAGFTKWGNGIVEFTNTHEYTGPSTLNEGTIQVKYAFKGDLILNGGTLLQGDNNLIDSSSNITITGGTYDMDGFTNTLNSLTMTGGTLTQAGDDKLTLTGTNGDNSLILEGGVNTGPGRIVISGTTDNVGNILVTNTSSSYAEIPNIKMDGASRTIDVSSGHPISDLIIGSSTGSGFTKKGLGTLELQGDHHHTGTALVERGTLKVSGAISPPSPALLLAKPLLTAALPAVTVANGATLTGTGTINGGVLVQTGGTINPGSTIGTLTVNNGGVTFDPGSIFHADLDFPVNTPVTDLLKVTGSGSSVTIHPGAKLEINPEPTATYGSFTYTLINTEGGLTGSFDSITILNQPATFISTINYNANSLFLIDTVLPFADVLDGNNSEIGNYLDNTSSAPGSDLHALLTNLHLSSLNQLNTALNKINPARIGSLALVQENNALAFRGSILNRVGSVTKKICSEKENSKPISFWTAGSANWQEQRATLGQDGFNSSTKQLQLGADMLIEDLSLVGLAGGFSKSTVNWQESSAKGHIDSGYASIYAHKNMFGALFADLSAVTAFSSYHADRQMNFELAAPAESYNRIAKADFGGWEFLGHFGLGYIYSKERFEAKPFVAVDYTSTHQENFKEGGANSLNLEVNSNTYSMLRYEAGSNFAFCLPIEAIQTTIDGKLSVIRENRMKGKSITAYFAGDNSTEGFTVSTLRPNRTLFSPAVGLSSTLLDGALMGSIRYEGEFGSHYRSHTATANLSLAF